MAYAKDLWTHPVKQADGTVVRERSKRWGRGKWWMAGWLDPEGNERTKVFSTKVAAELHGAAMETDGARGEYIDPNAGKVRFEGGCRAVAEVKGGRSGERDQVRVLIEVACFSGLRAEAIEEYQASEIAAWIADLGKRFGSSTARTAFLVPRGTLELAVDDDLFQPGGTSIRTGVSGS